MQSVRVDDEPCNDVTDIVVSGDDAMSVFTPHSVVATRARGVLAECAIPCGCGLVEDKVVQEPFPRCTPCAGGGPSAGEGVCSKEGDDNFLLRNPFLTRLSEIGSA